MHDSAQMRGTTDNPLNRDFEALRTVSEERLPSLAETERRLHERLRTRGVARRKVMVVGGIAALCSTALGAPLLMDELHPRKANVPTPSTRAADRVVPEANASHATGTKPNARTEAAQQGRAKRDALRREIGRHVPVSAADTKIVAEPRAEPEARSTGLKNKLGPGREKLVAFLNEDFTPLLAECVEQAEARSPNLAGMFFIGIETLAYQDLGAVVEVADPTDRNQVADPLFLECVRESAFTLIIPPPLTSGQERFEVSGYFGSRPTAEE